jgi:hypothetical protein
MKLPGHIFLHSANICNNANATIAAIVLKDILSTMEPAEGQTGGPSY